MKLPPKCIFSALRALYWGLHVFFNIVALEGVIKFLIIKWGLKNIAVILSEIHDPPHSKENGSPTYHHPNFLMYGLPIHESAKVQSIHNQ